MPRPRIYPEGATSKDRMEESRKALKKAHGAFKTFRLRKRSLTALKRIMRRPQAPDTETAFIEWLLVEFDHMLVLEQRLRGEQRAERHLIRENRRKTAERRQRWTLAPLEASTGEHPVSRPRRLGWVRSAAP